MTPTMKDKVVIITGGAAGIGKATAHRFADEGAIVEICDLDQAKGRATAAELRDESFFSSVDVSSAEQVRNWISAVLARHGRIDVLINNAGIIRDGQLVKFKDGAVVKEMSEEDWNAVIDVNLKGTFLCGRAVVPAMVAQGSGVILNATSIVGLDGNFGQTNYVATKAGVIGMTKVWSRELGKFGIRVNAIAPGFTATEILDVMPPKVIESMKARTPLGRLATPTEIADAYLFLASDQASFITGQTLRVDGGIVIGT